PWYGDSMRKILQGINTDAAFVRPVSKRHCIAELLAHIISWRELLNKRLQGDNTFDVNQKESFEWQRFGTNHETAWKNLLNKLEENQKQIIQNLERADDTLLEQKVSRREYTYRYLIQGTMQHDIYHSGQIALLKKSD
ncbi:MAG: DinB family protein, partial [Chitinophagaceae bacterium]